MSSLENNIKVEFCNDKYCNWYKSTHLIHNSCKGRYCKKAMEIYIEQEGRHQENSIKVREYSRFLEYLEPDMSYICKAKELFPEYDKVRHEVNNEEVFKCMLEVVRASRHMDNANGLNVKSFIDSQKIVSLNMLKILDSIECVTPEIMVRLSDSLLALNSFGYIAKVMDFINRCKEGKAYTNVHNEVPVPHGLEEFADKHLSKDSIILVYNNKMERVRMVRNEN